MALLTSLQGSVTVLQTDVSSLKTTVSTIESDVQQNKALLGTKCDDSTCNSLQSDISVMKVLS